MKLGALAALDQRIGLRYAMPPMTGEETGSYLRHDAAPSVMRRGPPNGLASSGVSLRTFRIIVRV
jgi:hypothetical protein